MKSLADLKAIRDKMRNQVNVRDENSDSVRIVVGMATCGIAAGAREVLNGFADEVNTRSLANVTVAQTGCIGLCQYEPIAEVMIPGQEKVTYGKVTKDMAKRIVEEHIVGGKPIAEYTIGKLLK